MPDIRDITIYPYTYKLVGIEDNPRAINEKFSQDNVQENIVEYTHDAFLLVVVDDISNNFVFGRFLKLKNDAPIAINRRDGSQRVVDILDEENIIEQSHFVMNTADKILFGEYNFQGIRHFAKPWPYYFNKLFDLQNQNEITPMPDVDTFDKLRGEEQMNRFTLRVAQQNLPFLEEKFGLSVSSGLMELASDNETSFEIVVRKSRKRESNLNKDKVVQLADQLKQENAPLEALKVETDDIVYDLINKNLISFKVSVKQAGRTVDSEDFYFKTRNLYERQAEGLKAMLRS
jgi:hypothetical protein